MKDLTQERVASATNMILYETIADSGSWFDGYLEVSGITEGLDAATAHQRLTNGKTAPSEVRRPVELMWRNGATEQAPTIFAAIRRNPKGNKSAAYRSKEKVLQAAYREMITMMDTVTLLVEQGKENRESVALATFEAMHTFNKASLSLKSEVQTLAQASRN
ncbi:MAG: hypothetical protein ACE5GT_02460 [Rhodospirillales bacterium]